MTSEIDWYESRIGEYRIALEAITAFESIKEARAALSKLPTTFETQQQIARCDNLIVEYWDWHGHKIALYHLSKIL